jgi:hypothetical protein
MRSRARLLGLTAIAVVGLGVIITLTLPRLSLLVGPERHADGQGPLASLDGPGSSSSAADRHSDTWTLTFGMRLCLTSSDSVLLDSVGPTQSIGTGYRVLGAKVRDFTPVRPGTHTPILAVSGFPPPVNMVPDPLYDVHGYTVTTQCHLSPDGPYTELLIGLSSIKDDGGIGGGWNGVDVGYTFGGRHRVLMIRIGLYFCGTSVADHCHTPAQASVPSVSP